MKYRFLIFSILTVVLGSAGSCKKDVSTETDIINDWIWDNMTDIYLWADEIDPGLYPTEETDPEAYFYSLRFREDRFSWIVDDYQALINSFNNIELSSGISPYFIAITGTEQVIMAVEFVSKKSPAYSAGIRRGDLVYRINNTDLNKDNFYDLFVEDSLSLEFAELKNSTLVPSGRKIDIVAEIVETNPIECAKIIPYEGYDIGYMAYTGFSPGEQDKWMDSIDNIFFEFLEAGIDNMILDLRYNRGGEVFVAQHIASVLAPSLVADGENVLVYFKWNDIYQNAIIDADGIDSDYLVVRFEEFPALNLDLEDIYFLTGRKTASASELIMIGLEPYMNTVRIGESTTGKFYGSITVSDAYDPPRHNWAMQPIVMKYENAESYTDFFEGLQPDILVDDNMLSAKPFGDISDPLIAAALEAITGISPVAKKRVPDLPGYKILPDPRKDKEDLIFDLPPFLVRPER